jgi:hypothetical protein
MWNGKRRGPCHCHPFEQRDGCQAGAEFLESPQNDPPYSAIAGSCGCRQEKAYENFQRSLPPYDSIYGNIPFQCFQHEEHWAREEK